MLKKALFTTTALTTAIGVPVAAQETPLGYGLNGLPGVIEMPIAQSDSEGALAVTAAMQEGIFRLNFGLQLTDRLSASAGFNIADVYDSTGSSVIAGENARAFSLQYRLTNETEYLPQIAIGLRDILTPGRLQSEYIVATKSIGDSLSVTAGLGWGAMATAGGFDNPIGGRAERPVFDTASADGQLATDQWFAGDAAWFGGASYQINEKWGVAAEYSSIAYTQQPDGLVLETDSPYNFGVTYRPADGVQLSFVSLYGRDVGVSGTFALNAHNRPSMGGAERAPVPVKVRSENARAAREWDRTQVSEPALRTAMATLMESEGLTLTGLEITDTSARVRYINGRYRSQAQAMGRVARFLTQVMPGSVEVFIFEPESRGIPLSATRIARSDVEALETRSGGADAMLQRAVFVDAGSAEGLTPMPSEAAAFTWGLGPYFVINPYGPDGAAQIDAGLKLQARYQITPQIVAAGSVVQSARPADPQDPIIDATPDLQNVRSDGGFYGDDGVPVLQDLTISYYGRPGPDLFSRISAGYLERMYGGVSSEILWKPVDSNLGLGAELNYVAQRDTDMAFGFSEYDYDVVTGHVSAYYDFGNGYHTQLDVGRYLAGDWGGTVTVAREYDNGVRISAYVAQTEVNYDDYGDGSYNKGVQIAIPQDFLLGNPSRKTYAATIRTRSGDGGAMLNVDGRLYEVVRDAHTNDLSDTWGRFWR